MKEYCVYILECADGRYYTGVTNDLERRLAEHQTGLDPKAWTYSRRPVKLVFHTQTNSIEYAIELEKRIKGWRKEKKKALIDNAYDLLPELSLAYRDRKKE